MSRLRFQPHYRCVILPSEGVFLLSEREHFLLQGRAYLKLAPLLNEGTCSEAEIVSRLEGELSAAEVYYALGLLRDNGHIVDASLPPERAPYWSTLAVEGDTAERLLGSTSVSVTSFGSIAADPLASMLVENGVRVEEDGDRWIVLVDDYLDPSLENFNHEALKRGRPWLLARPAGTELWLGPIFTPGEGGCWECLANRLRGHRKIERYLQEKSGSLDPFTPPLSFIPATVQMALAFVASETIRWIGAAENGGSGNEVITLDLLSRQIRRHPLTRRPQCPRCGSPAIGRANGSIASLLGSRRKSHMTDGGHRSVSPRETLAKLERHVSRITGIIGAIHEVDPSIGSIAASYVTDHNFVHMNDDLYFLRESLRGRSGGKGKQDIQARASALCESIERYSGVYQGDEPRLRGSFASLGVAAIHPNACMLYSDTQFENRAEWNARGSHFNRVPERFDEEEEIEWSPVWSLNDESPRYLPTAYCYYGYARQHRIAFADADSNGSAAGNSKEEAILQGFMEVVERDSVALWWYNRLKRPAVDLSSFDDPYIEQLSDYYRTLHRDLVVLDITTDLGIPSFAALSRRTDKETEDIIFGFGTHFDPQVGLLRALTEMNQSLPAVPRGDGSTPDSYLYPDGEAVAWWKQATLANQPYLIPDQKTPARSLSDYPQFWSDDLFTDVMTCSRIVEERGLEMFVLDQTRPDTGLDVVKVIVPGLRHFWARLAPGRLYDIPVQMAWLEHPRAEAELNPIPMFF